MKLKSYFPFCKIEYISSILKLYHLSHGKSKKIEIVWYDKYVENSILNKNRKVCFSPLYLYDQYYYVARESIWIVSACK